MLISRLAHCFFVSPEFVLSGWNTFIFLKMITGSFSCFRCLIFKVLCAPLFFRSAWLFYHIFLALSRTFFRSFFSRAFLFYHTVSGLSRTFFCSLWFGTFLSYHNQSRFVKIFFRSVERLTILPRFLPPVNAFFPFFSPFCSVCEFRLFYSQFIHNCLLPIDNPLICPYISNYLLHISFFAILRTFYLYLL